MAGNVKRRTGLKRWWQETEPWYFSIGLANLVMGTSSVLVPLMISHVLHRSVAALGVLSTVVSLVGVIGSLFWGRLSDVAHRRKPFVILSYLALTGTFSGIALSRSFNTLLLHNVILNLFWVANAAVSVLLVIENQDESGWEGRISRLNQVGAIGWLAGLVLGSVALAAMTKWGSEESAIRTLFVILAVGALGAVVLAVRLIPRTEPKFTQRSFRGAILAVGNFLVERARYAPYHLYHRVNPRALPNLLRGREGLRPETKRFLLATFFAFTGIGFFAVPLPLLLSERFGLSSSMVFTYFVVSHTAVVLAYPAASRRIKRSGNKAVQMGTILTRLLLFTATAIFLAVSPEAPPTLALVVFFILIGLTWAYFQLSGVALISRLAKPTLRGQALGLYNAITGIGIVTAGISSGYATDYVGYQASFGAAAVFLGVALVILYFLPSPSTPQTPHPEPKKDRNVIPDQMATKS